MQPKKLGIAQLSLHSSHHWPEYRYSEGFLEVLDEVSACAKNYEVLASADIDVL